ncbi:MAG: hypothetical protein JRI25_16405 [Deltaproteobacteria bacterium]|nr:hypothetical protein [Deltaproteobacteria bacterium]
MGRVSYKVEGPLELRYGDDGTLVVSELVLSYLPVPHLERREWTAEFAIEGLRRFELLALHEAEVSPITPPQILRLGLSHPIHFTFLATDSLAARLDAVEDETPVVVDGVLQDRVRDAATDLGGWGFEGLIQGPGVAPE